MASQTKIEPVDVVPRAPTSGANTSSRVIVEEQGRDAAPPASSTGSLVPGQSALGDDEDVSLDELMMSDSNDGDDANPTGKDEGGAAVAAHAPGLPEHTNEADPSRAIDAFGVDPLDDEAAALAAAAAAQEAAAQAAAEEADARVADARRGGEVTAAPQGGAVGSAPESAEASAVVEDAQAPEALAAAPADELDETPFAPATNDLDPPSSSDLDPPMSVELEPPSRQFESPPEAASETTATPASSSTPAASAPAVPRRDGPLPSFDIPEVDSRRGRRAASSGADEKARGPHPMAASLSHLSEVGEEDDDDAVTHIGLPVVPEAPEDYPGMAPGGFQVAGASVAALHGFDPDVSLAETRRATTRVVQRIDPAQLQSRRATSDTNPALSTGRRVSSGGVGAWLSGVFRRIRPEPPQNDVLPPVQRRTGWLLDTVLPPLSLVLFGSGIGAGIMLLQPDRGAKAAQQGQTIQALKESPAAKRPTTLSERAEAGEGDALFKVTNMSPNDRSSALTLALERGYQAQKQNEFKEFAQKLEGAGGMQTPNLTTRFLNYAISPETMLAAFAHLLTWPGTTGPDVLYAVWEKAPGGNRAASLAQQLLHSPDQRGKATPALVTALDLRSATSCDDYLRVLPGVLKDGDQRCSATLRALKHTDGCGDDGQQDCFACLRDTTLLDDALTAIEGRVPPQL